MSAEDITYADRRVDIFLNGDAVEMDCRGDDFAHDLKVQCKVAHISCFFVVNVLEICPHGFRRSYRVLEELLPFFPNFRYFLLRCC